MANRIFSKRSTCRAAQLLSQFWCRRSVSTVSGLILVLGFLHPACGEPSPSPSPHNPLGFMQQSGAEKLPTYVKSDTLQVESEKRQFTYRNNIEVLQGDLRLTAQELVGFYNEKNELTKLEAHKQVVITKGDQIRATGDQATYDKIKNTLILTDNPELQKTGSVLTADKILVHLDTNQTEAEGNVRVKLVQDPNAKTAPLTLSGLAKK